MNEYIESALLAIVQGLTEFLPISSSAHLILAGELMGRDAAAGAAFDVAVHVGSLLAVLVYFRSDQLDLARGALRATGRGRTKADLGHARLAWAIALGTIPAALCGLLLKDWIEGELRDVRVVAWASIGFGLLLYVADRIGRRIRAIEAVGLRDALFVGAFQALALIPGTSRSGATMTAGLFGGLTRRAAAHYSFLLSIPLIAAAGALKARDLLALPSASLDWGVLGVGVALSAVSAYLCIDVFLRLVERLGMTPFVVYRVLLGVAILILAG